MVVGLFIIYFKQYNTYHDTHEVIFDMYQQYILSGGLTDNTYRCRLQDARLSKDILYT